MAKRTKIASLPGFAVYLDSEAKENERYQVYSLWHDNHPEYGYLRKRKTLVGKYHALSSALAFITEGQRAAEDNGNDKWYYPCTKYVSTSYPAHTLQSALNQFSIWEESFPFTEAWIDVYENGKKVDTIPVEKTWNVKEN